MKTHEIYKVTDFAIVGHYTLLVGFDDGSEQQIDFRPVLSGELFGSLCDLELFNMVSIDPEVHTLVWPNGADFDPAMLHNWNRDLASILAGASRFEGVHV